MNELIINTNSGFQTRVELMFDKLKGAEKKAIQYIRDNQNDIIHLSITEVADASNTSESTIVRLCKKLAYKGFQDLKINLARETINPQKQIHEMIEPEDDILTIKRKVFQSNIQALYDTLDVFENEQLEKAVNLITTANKLEIYGTGASGTVALDAQHKFLKIGIKCFVNPDVHLQSMSASLLGEGDVVLGISHTGSNKDTVYAMNQAKQQGAKIICITNFSKSPITNISDVHLFTASKETMFRTDATASRIAQLTIIDTILASIVSQRHEVYYQNVQKTRASTINRRY